MYNFFYYIVLNRYFVTFVPKKSEKKKNLNYDKDF